MCYIFAKVQKCTETFWGPLIIIFDNEGPRSQEGYYVSISYICRRSWF